MTSFDWWRSMAGQGQFMCAVCYECKPVEQASVDADGVKWDVCLECKASERGYAELLLDRLVGYWHDSNSAPENIVMALSTWLGMDDELYARWAKDGNSVLPDERLWGLARRAQELRLEP